ncbi:hypothetical protein F5148DRAFT_1275356 [Russula earlei]|uniref:Uncharacterized protein n=1 Tax=Russula earlei TaxID=71964 RepID=A0ACC0UCG8_9AGAM|nr:hypothetical protein F5148DRAFT_1275356 [Russula earlei]
MSQPGRSPLSTVFLLHIALEAPLAVQGIWFPTSLPFLQLNNTTIVVLKMYATLVLSVCIIALLCFPLPEFLPGKRALAIGLCVYHSIISTVLFQAPRFIPYSFGPFFEAYKVTPEIVWGCFHGFLGLGFVAWWQSTVAFTQMMKRAE